MLKRAIEGENIGKNLDQTYRLLGIKKGTYPNSALTTPS